MRLVTIAVSNNARTREIHSSVAELRRFAREHADEALLVLSSEAMRATDQVAAALGELLPGDVAMLSELLELLEPEERDGALSLSTEGKPITFGSAGVAVLFGGLNAPAEPGKETGESAPTRTAAPAAAPRKAPPPPAVDPQAFQVAIKVARNVLNDQNNPLPSRVGKALHEGELTSLTDVLLMTDDELVAVPQIGDSTVRALQVWVERESERHGKRLDRDEIRALLQSAPPDVETIETDGVERAATTKLEKIVVDAPQPIRDLPIAMLGQLPSPAPAWLRKNAIKTVGDLEPWSEKRLAMRRNMGPSAIRPLRDAIARLIHQVKRIDPKGTASSAELLAALIRLVPLTERLRQTLVVLPGEIRRIVERRAFHQSGIPTLQDIEEHEGYDGAEVLKFEAFARDCMDRGGHVAAFLDARLAELRAGRTEPLSIEEAEEAEPWLADFADAPHLLRGVLRLLDCKHAVCERDTVRPYVTLATAVDVAALADACRNHLDLHAQTSEMQREIETYLDERGVPELLGVVRTKLELRLVSRVELELASADGPLSVTELHERLSALGVHVAERKLLATLERDANRTGGVVLVGPSLWCLTDSLARFAGMRPQIQRLLAELLTEHPDCEWSACAILREGVARKHAFAKELPEHALNWHLRSIPDFVYRAGFLWAPASRGLIVEDVIEIAAEILRENDAPLPYAELVRRVRDRRAEGPALQILAPLVRVGDQITLEDPPETSPEPEDATAE